MHHKWHVKFHRFKPDSGFCAEWPRSWVPRRPRLHRQLLSPPPLPPLTPRQRPLLDGKNCWRTLPPTVTTTITTAQSTLAVMPATTRVHQEHCRPSSQRQPRWVTLKTWGLSQLVEPAGDMRKSQVWDTCFVVGLAHGWPCVFHCKLKTIGWHRSLNICFTCK